MNRWKDILGIALLFAGVGGILGGVRGISGGDGWGGPALGAGVVANALAYRVIRSTTSPRRTDESGSDRADGQQ
jgi:hypothetical protein